VSVLRQKSRWLLLPVASYLVLLIDWSGSPAPAEPQLLRAFHVSAVLKAGAARVRIAPPLPLMRPTSRYPAVMAESEQDPLEVRAIVLRSGGKTLALVLADLMVITDDLSRGLESRLSDLHLDGILFVATHTHSSVGGFDAHRAAQILGLGPFRPDVVDAVLTHSAQAVREAQSALVRVHVRTGETRLPEWAWNRATLGAEVDDALTVVALDAEGGGRVATLAIVSAHPTLFPRATPELSADYPGITMRLLEETGGVAFLFQGAEGDAAAPGAGLLAMKSAGSFVAERVRAAVETTTASGDGLGFVEVQVGLPAVDVQRPPSFFLRRPVSNIVGRMLPRTARVGVVTLGDITLLTVAGEPTASAARQMVAALPAEALAARKVRVIALAQAYVSYIDTPECIRARTGESHRAWYGPELLDVITRGLRTAVDADLRLR
jgi:neutral ceramidase